MKGKNYYAFITLAIIFIFVLGIRIQIAYKNPNFNDGEAYWNLMQAQHIKEHGLPKFNDELSYSGRTYYFSPLFHYLLAFFNLFLPLTIVGKIIPNLFASTLVLIVYWIAKEITKDDISSIFASIIAGFIPIFMSSTTNSVSVYSLLFPIIFLASLCFIKIKKKEYFYSFLTLIILLGLTHPGAIIFIIGLIAYFALLKIENIAKEAIEIQSVIFGSLIFILIQLIIFIRPMLMHGPSIIWQNIPIEIIRNYYSEATILTLLLSIGTISLMYGIYATYYYLFRIREKKIYFFIAFAITVSVFLWLKIVEPTFGMIALGGIMSVLFSLFYLHSWKHLKRTKFDKYKKIILSAFFILLTMTVIIPSLYNTEKKIEESVNSHEIEALIWLKKNTPKNSIIISSIDEGMLISSIAERKNIADTHYLLIKDIEQRYKDIKSIFTSLYKTNAIELLNKYKINYILLTDKTKKHYEIEKLSYTDDKKCFREVFSNEKTKIFQVLCELK